MQMTVNKEINSIEKPTTNLDLARDRQIRRKIFKSFVIFVGVELDLGLWLILLYYLFLYLQSFASFDP